jgi:hypothetical protein
MHTIILKKIIEHVPEVSYKIDAIDIHPSMLNGLIPISTPCFLNEKRRNSTCSSIGLELPISISDVEGSELYVVFNAIEEIIRYKSEWNYLYNITIIEDRLKEVTKGLPGIKVIIRGA